MTGFKLTRQNQHQEHTLQERIVIYLYRMHCRTIDTDVMDACKYLSPLPTDTISVKKRKEAEKQKYIKIHHQRGYTNGQPDLVVLVPNGQVLFVELKTPKGVQSGAQKDFQRQAEFMGHTYVIWRSLDDAIEFFKEFNKGYDVQTTGSGVCPLALCSPLSKDKR